LLIEIIFSIHGADTQCGIKAFKSKIAHDIFSRLYIKGLVYDVDVFLIAKQLGAKVCFVPINWSHSKSTIKLRKVARSVMGELLMLKKYVKKLGEDC
jgi:dolichyl-phosphate beta-glucosyltransferase